MKALREMLLRKQADRNKAMKVKISDWVIILQIPGRVFGEITIITFCHTVLMDGMTDMIKYMNRL